MEVGEDNKSGVGVPPALTLEGGIICETQIGPQLKGNPVFSSLFLSKM